MKRIFLVLMLLFSTFAFPQTAYAKTYTLNIHNNTEESVKVVLKGDENYSFTVAPGKREKTVEEGTYDVSYSACNGLIDVDEEITVTKNGIWIAFGPCPAELVLAKFVINSNIAETFTLSMSGPENYELSLGLGKNKFFDIVSGTYTYTHDYCGYDIAGVVRVLKNGTARMTLNGCEREEILSFGVPNPTNIRMASHYAFPITVTLIGPKQYYFTLELGFTRADVIRGTYTYIYTAYNKNYSGEIFISGGGPTNTIVFSPIKPEP